MKVKLDSVIKDITGNTVKDEKGEEIVAKNLFLNALLTPITSNEGRPVQDTKKVEKFKLALKIEKVKKNKEAEITIEEATLLKTSVDKIFTSPLIVGRLHEILGEI